MSSLYSYSFLKIETIGRYLTNFYDFLVVQKYKLMLHLHHLIYATYLLIFDIMNQIGLIGIYNKPSTGYSLDLF